MSERAGQDIVDCAVAKKGQKYVYGALVPKNNPDWNGPWDCAEFVSWCAFQAHGIVFGMRPAQVDKGDAYSGYWYDDAVRLNAAIPWRQALMIPGAVLVRRPDKKRALIGHVAISLGDGQHTVEARSTRDGVGVFDRAGERVWDIGVLLPGVEYPQGQAVAAAPVFTAPPAPWPAGYYGLRTPRQKGVEILELQITLARLGFNPGPLDGDFGDMTSKAVLAFQLTKGLVVDGLVGPETLEEMGLAAPLTPSAEAVSQWQALNRITSAGVPVTTGVAAGKTAIVGHNHEGGKHSVALKDGTVLFVGSETSYTDDSHRRGLYQSGSDLKKIAAVGVFNPGEYSHHGPWVHFIAPTVQAESAGYFGRINTYDRAAFTFGLFQMAAHTPNANLIVLFRALLKLPSASLYFPELSLVNGKVTLTKPNGATQDLEKVVTVTRPNGKQEQQIKFFMDYLNPDPAAVGQEEVSAAARLMLWTQSEREARVTQVDLMIARAKKLIQETKGKVPAFDGSRWEVALWILDIRHQGRATYLNIASALAQPHPLSVLPSVGNTGASRKATIQKGIEALKQSGVLDGFKV